MPRTGCRELTAHGHQGRVLLGTWVLHEMTQSRRDTGTVGFTYRFLLQRAVMDLGRRCAALPQLPFWWVIVLGAGRPFVLPQSFPQPIWHQVGQGLLP